jgi:hypothetical protein
MLFHINKDIYLFVRFRISPLIRFTVFLYYRSYGYGFVEILFIKSVLGNGFALPTKLPAIGSVTLAISFIMTLSFCMVATADAQSTREPIYDGLIVLPSLSQMAGGREHQFSGQFNEDHNDQNDEKALSNSITQRIVPELNTQSSTTASIVHATVPKETCEMQFGVTEPKEDTLSLACEGINPRQPGLFGVPLSVSVISLLASALLLKASLSRVR